MHPSLTGIGLVPLCPHALSNRPIVVGDRSEIELRVASGIAPRVHSTARSPSICSVTIRYASGPPPTAFACSIRRLQLFRDAAREAPLERAAARVLKAWSAMLLRLTIRDFILVDRLELEFAAGFGALTGETGAGKSILIDALSFVLGERADAGLVRPGAERAEVSAEFDVARWWRSGPPRRAGHRRWRRVAAAPRRRCRRPLAGLSDGSPVTLQHCAN